MARHSIHQTAATFRPRPSAHNKARHTTSQTASDRSCLQLYILSIQTMTLNEKDTYILLWTKLNLELLLCCPFIYISMSAMQCFSNRNLKQMLSSYIHFLNYHPPTGKLFKVYLSLFWACTLMWRIKTSNKITLNVPFPHVLRLPNAKKRLKVL